MKSNLYNPPALTYNEIVPTLFTVLAGAAGFVETDCSAVLPSGRVIVLVKIGTGNQVIVVGAREPGSAVDTSFSLQDGNSAVGRGSPVIATSIDGYLELYRNAAFPAYYSVMGYVRLS